MIASGVGGRYAVCRHFDELQWYRDLKPLGLSKELNAGIGTDFNWPAATKSLDLSKNR